MAQVLDGAGWHTSTTLVIPDGIDLIRLPACSPELQLAERGWPLVDEPWSIAPLAIWRTWKQCWWSNARPYVPLHR
jgi:hypothetical protein